MKKVGKATRPFRYDLDQILYNYTVEEKRSYNSDNLNDVITTHLEPDILECEIKSDLVHITINITSGGDGIPAELFQIVKDDALKVLNSRCQQIWKTHQWS